MSASSSPVTSSWLRDTVSSLTWRHLAVTAAIGLLAGFLQIATGRALFLFWKDNWDQRIYMLKEFLGLTQLAAFAFLFCLVGADQAIRRGAPRGLAYGTALLVACSLYTALDLSIRWYVMDWFSKPFVMPWFRKSAPISKFMDAALMGGLATFVYADWQQARMSAARLHAATLARTEAARETLRAQLHAMQARVDPQWLFDTLDRVKRYYDADPARGNRTLDDLILYLRNAMPQLRGNPSTIAREVELARAYVTIVNDCSTHEMRFDADLADLTRAATFPPMLLLPVVQCAFAGSGAVSPERNVLSIQAGERGGRLQVAIVHGGAAFALPAGETLLEPVRQRLHAYFEGAASFEARARNDGTSHVVMEMPYEPA